MADITVNNTWTSGSFSTTNNYVKFVVEITEQSYNIENNTSSVRVRVLASRTNSGYTTYGTGSCTVNIAGTSHTQAIASSQTITQNSNTAIFDKTVTVPHAEDGTLTLTTSTSWSINATGSGGYNYTGTTSAVSFNRALTTIPRASDIACNSPAVMASTQSVTVTQKSATFSHILYGSTDGETFTEIGRGTASGAYNWTLPDITASIPNADSATYTLRCETFTNSTYEGDALISTLAITATVPASYVPTITIGTITEGNANVPNGFPFLQGISTLNVPTTFTGSAGSTVVSRSVTANGETQTSTSAGAVTFNLTKPLTGTTTTVQASTTDSRGRTGTASRSVSVTPYTAPSIVIDCTRCQSDGTIDALGEYVLVRARWSWTSIKPSSTELNSASIKVSVDGTLKATYTTTTNAQANLTQIAILPNMSATNQYTITAEITDRILSASTTQTVTKAVLPFSLFDDGNGVGASVGRMATAEGFHIFLDEHEYVGTNEVYHGDTEVVNDKAGALYDKSVFGSASGTDISLDLDGNGKVTELKTAFEPVQNLNGYDKPWVGGAGQNLLDISSATVGVPVYGFTISADGDIITVTGTYTRDGSSASFRIVRNIPTNADAHFVGFVIEGENNFDRVRWADSTSISLDLKNLVQNNTYTFKLRIVEYVGDVPTEYTPYSNICPITGTDAFELDVNGDTTTYDFANESSGTVYGGTLDLLTGELTLNYACESFTSFGGYAEGNGFRTDKDVAIRPASAYPQVVCNMFTSAGSYSEAVNQNGSYPNRIGMNAEGRILLNMYKDGAVVTSLAEINAMIPSSGCQVLYPINPITYQLTPAQIELLSGQNDITATNTINLAYTVPKGIARADGNAVSIVDTVYPVGSIYMSVNNTSPETLFGGTWQQIKDTFLLSAGDTYTAGDTGGEAEHTLTTTEMPAHSHTGKYIVTDGHSSGSRNEVRTWDTASGQYTGTKQITNSVGGGQAHNNMPPYLVVYMWKRTA